VTEQSDAELVEAVLGGQLSAFGVLVRRYQNTYVRFATRMLGSRDDADDALQSAFVRAYRALRSCRDPERFGAWLYQIVVNECRTFAARRDRRERRLVRHNMAAVQADAARARDDPAELDEIQHALRQLDDDHREAFLLKHVEELDYNEMSDLTGASISALKMRVMRARERLRALLDPVRSNS
jgi:RNA polymerase sigma-70 factor (ECF subfamily)